MWQHEYDHGTVKGKEENDQVREKMAKICKQNRIVVLMAEHSAAPSETEVSLASRCNKLKKLLK